MLRLTISTWDTTEGRYLCTSSHERAMLPISAGQNSDPSVHIFEFVTLGREG